MTYEYVLSLQDKVSGTMHKVTGVSGVAADKFSALQQKTRSVDQTSKDFGRSIDSLRQKIELLKGERDIIDPNNLPLIKQYNREITNLTGEVTKLENSASGGPLKRWFNDLKQSSPVVRAILNPMALLGAATYKLGSYVKASEGAWLRQIESETKLSAVMKNTMDAGEDELRTILRLTDAQEKMGIIGRNVQTAGAQELSTYLSKSDNLQRLIPVMNDMLAQQYGYNASQEQAINIASMMGKVMDGQVGALSRYGYKFSEAQELILKFGNEEQRAATLAEVVTSAVGGVNKALAETPEGKIKKQADLMNSLQERVGKLYTNIKAAFIPVGEMVASVLGGIVGWFEQHGDKIMSIVGAVTKGFQVAFKIIGGAISGVFGAFRWWFDMLRGGSPLVWGLTTVLGLFTAALIANKVATNGAMIATQAKAVIDGVVIGATKVWTAVQWALNAAFLASPLGWIVLAIGAVVGAVTWAWNKFESFRQVVIGVWEVMKMFGKLLFDNILGTVKKLIGGIGALGTAIGKLFKGDFKGAGESAKEGFKMLFEASPVGQVKNIVTDVKNADWSGAWEKGKVKGSESWERSQERKATRDAARNPVVPQVPEFVMPDPYDMSGVDMAALKRKAEAEKKGKGSKGSKGKTLDLNSIVHDLQGSTNYNAIAGRLKNVIVPALTSAAALATPAVNIDAQLKNQPIQDRVAATMMASNSEATDSGRDLSWTDYNQGGQKSVSMEKFCNQIVINVHNGDRQDAEEITDRVMEELKSAVDNYEA